MKKRRGDLAALWKSLHSPLPRGDPTSEAKQYLLHVYVIVGRTHLCLASVTYTYSTCDTHFTLQVDGNSRLTGPDYCNGSPLSLLLLSVFNLTETTFFFFSNVHLPFYSYA